MNELKHLLALVAVIIAICVAGNFDYNDEVIESMSSGTYEVLRERLGDVSAGDLVDAYMSDRKYWDSLGQIK